MTTRWYAARDKKKLGPMSPAELTDLIRSGQLQPQDMVLQEGTQNWLPVSRAREVLETSAALPAPAPATTTPLAQSPPVADAPGSSASADAAEEAGQPWPRRAIAEIKTTTRATRAGVGRLVHWVRCAWQRRRGRRALASAAQLLGRRMAAAGVGNDNVRVRLEELDSQRHWPISPAAWRGQLERKALYRELAHPALESSTAAPGLEAEHAAAAKALEECNRADKAWHSAGDVLLPAEALEQRRLLLGCGSVAVAVLVLTIIIMVVIPAEPRVQTTVLQGELPAGVSPLALAPDLGRAAGAGSDNAINVWAVPGGEVAATLAGHEQPVQALDFGPRGKLLASAGLDRSVRIWDVAHAGQRRQLASADGVLALKFAPDGDLLAAGLADGTIKLWETETGTERATLRGYPRGPLAFSPDGKRLAAGGLAFGPNNESSGVVKIWDVASGNELPGPPALKSEIYCLAYASDGQTLAAGTRESVRLWEANAWQARGHLLHGRDCNVRSLAFSSNGKWLATGGSDKHVILWEVGTETRLVTLVGHRPGVQGQILSLAFARNGKSLASAASDHTVVRWNNVGDLNGWADANELGRKE